MPFSRGPKEPVSEVETKVWACRSETCNGWMRASYSFNEQPECPLCQSSMKEEIRTLPELE